MLWSRKTWSSGSVTSIDFIISDSWATNTSAYYIFGAYYAKSVCISETKWSAYRTQGTVYECGTGYSRQRYHTGV